MALEQKLSLKLAQKLVMTPSLQQAIKLLQMTRLELEGALTQELVENPVLEEGAEAPKARRPTRPLKASRRSTSRPFSTRPRAGRAPASRPSTSRARERRSRTR
jgi:DNA-directed RNA polymerase specialized sigma54-like protein